MRKKKAVSKPYAALELPTGGRFKWYPKPTPADAKILGKPSDPKRRIR